MAINRAYIIVSQPTHGLLTYKRRTLLILLTLTSTDKILSLINHDGTSASTATSVSIQVVAVNDEYAPVVDDGNYQ